MRELKVDRIISQVLQIRDTYNCDIYNVSYMREIAYHENLTELYNFICENSSSYYNLINNGYSIDL